MRSTQFGSSAFWVLSFLSIIFISVSCGTKKKEAEERTVLSSELPTLDPDDEKLAEELGPNSCNSAGGPAGYGIITGPNMISVGQCAGPFDMSHQASCSATIYEGSSSSSADQSIAATAVSKDITIYFSSNRRSMKFFGDSACTNSIYGIIIKKGNTGARFWLKDSVRDFKNSQRVEIGVDTGKNFSDPDFMEAIWWLRLTSSY